MTGGFSRGRSKRYPYYCCTNTSCVGRKSYPTDDIAEEFREFLDEIAPRPELFDKLGEVITDAAIERRKLSGATNARRKMDLDKLDRQRQELIRMRSEGLITDQEFLKQKNHISEQSLAIGGVLQNDQLDPQAIQKDLEFIKRPLSDLGATWSGLIPARQRRFNRIVLPGGFITGTIRTAEKALLFSAPEDFDRPNANGVRYEGESLNRIIREILEFSEFFRPTEEVEEAA
jgi:hypothetical protein